MVPTGRSASSFRIKTVSLLVRLPRHISWRSLTSKLWMPTKMASLNLERKSLCERFESRIRVRPLSIQLILGGAPSPKFAQVTLQGLSTAWLVAPQTTLTLPVSIMNGSTITLPGTIVFRAKRANTFPVGRVFQVDDAFKLQGYMSKIGRNIPGFHLPKKVTIQHPVKMTAPRYLRCLTVGQEAVFSWTVYLLCSIAKNRWKIIALRISAAAAARNVRSN
jgi:hypothetical protein